ncbi:uncharacterized protein HMF8227_02885 [Saliniradius amylolyticus]|uniref:EfeO-type cupredoxin-like domain-containing protein n=1 Tax=Saliniradius amylolyticus TaxID=2183582 RepID=A0A2S2E6R5_9ALTE|nr:cupredoxin domain-containing protein [Saliniradius amylolyticus]AWL13333.1 uncharacterized protein HMF8227_02885 [Saliniradius amylolyticus]
MRCWLVLTFLFTASALAELPQVELRLKDHLFYPSLLKVPAGQKIKLRVHNQDATTEEFDSFDLNREKVLFPNSSTTIYIGPLYPGEYHFFGEFNPNQAQGIIIALPDKEVPDAQ